MATRAQGRLVQQIKEMERVLRLDPDEILREWADDPDGILPNLRRILTFFVRAEVLTSYTLLDVLLSVELRRHFFVGKRPSRRAPRMRTFNLMMRELYPIQKLRLIKSYRNVPRGVEATITSLTDVRNAMAHDFFMENRSGKVAVYKKVDLFEPDGMRQFKDDVFEAERFLAPAIAEAALQLAADTSDDEGLTD